MSIRRSQQRQLRGIELTLLQADPQLASLLNVFSRSTAGQGLPAWEQVSSRRDQVREASRLAGTALLLALTGVALMLQGVAALLGALAGCQPGPRHLIRIRI